MVMVYVLIMSTVRVYALIGRTRAYSDMCTLRMRKTSRAGPASTAMASQGEAVCVLEGVIRGHHVYKATWTPTVGEILVVRQEPGNDHDRHVVCIERGAEIVGRIPRELSWMVWHFLVHGSQATCEVAEKVCHA